jgi:polyhydroxyalkanoate synthase
MSKQVQEVAARPASRANRFIGLNARDLVAAAGDIAGGALKAPLTVLEHEAGVVRNLAQVLAGKSEIVPSQGDRRFGDETWQLNPFYKRYLQGYLATTNAVNGFIDDLGLQGRKAERAKVLTSLVTEALAPSNGLLTNPAAVKKTVATGGRNLLDGLKNFAADLQHNEGMPAQVDMTAFEVGRNLALSPGAVVFRNEVLELLQYQPTTAKVHVRPLMLVPPQINKFYALDLAPGKSMVEYLVASGFQVFVVSWRNPAREHSHWGLSQFVLALKEAIAAIKEITGSKDLNIQGACSGAMTVTALLGHLTAKKDRSVKSFTHMVAVLDQATDSQLNLFASPATVALAKAASSRKGVLEGKDMARVFAWLRPNDLVWNYWVNNYLMGNAPPAFDVLYWNNDTTRLTSKFHSEILDAVENQSFSRPGALKVAGTPIDISKITVDRYAVAGMTDHITPWRDCYRTAHMVGGKVTMVVSSSGHIQSLINPPGNPKAKYFVNEQSPSGPEEWLRGATPVADSWWGHWREWLVARSGRLKKAPARLGSASHPPGDVAPGTYARDTDVRRS